MSRAEDERKRHEYMTKNRRGPKFKANNFIHLEDGTTVIELSKNKSTTINTIDYPLVKSYRWHTHKVENTYYASTALSIIEHNGETLNMHRVICPCPKWMVVDHIDGDGLNNTRGNLRAATPAQNISNHKIFKNNSSGYSGICWDNTFKKWKVSIKRKHILHTRCLKRAIDARKKAEHEYFREFARI